MKINNYLIKDFLYSPKFKLIRKKHLLIYPTLEIIISLNKQLESDSSKVEFKATTNEIKKKILSDYGIQLENEAIDLILYDLKQEEWITYLPNPNEKLNIISCTENGLNYYKKSSKEEKEVINEVKKYFVSEFKGRYNRQFPNDDLNLSEAEWNSLFKAFYQSMEFYVEKINIGTLSLRKKRAYPDYISALKSNKSYNNICSNCKEINERFIIRENHPKEYERLYTNILYHKIALRILSDNTLKQFLSKDLEHKKICLDTNALISIIASSEINHQYMQFFLKYLKNQYLKKDEKNKLNVFYFDETLVEFNYQLELARNFIQDIRLYSPEQLNEIAYSRIRIPIFARDFLKGRWYSWKLYQEFILKRLKKLNELCQDSLEKYSNIKVNEKTKSDVKRILGLYYSLYSSRDRRKSKKQLDHDVSIIAKIITLRNEEKEREKLELSNSNHDLSLILIDFFLLTFDKIFLRFSQDKKVIEHFGEQPLFIGKKALQLLMWPHMTTMGLSIIDEGILANKFFIPYEETASISGIKKSDKKFETLISEYIRSQIEEEIGDTHGKLS